MAEDNNDLLLQQFFSEAAQQQIADNGFTERVMQALPQQSTFNIKLFNRLWTLFCVAVFVVLFVVFRGWELLAVHFMVMLRTVAAGVIQHQSADADHRVFWTVVRRGGRGYFFGNIP